MLHGCHAIAARGAGQHYKRLCCMLLLLQNACSSAATAQYQYCDSVHMAAADAALCSRSHSTVKTRACKA
eukprot:19704-Heterococcus_DN1.PRE.5